MNKKVITITLSVVSLLLLIGGVTYAFYEWVSDTNTDITFNVDGLKVIYNGGSNITDASLVPTETKEEGVTKTLELQLDSNQIITPTPTASLYLDLTAFPSALADSSFKWELYKNEDTTPISIGDFSGKTQGDTINLISNQTVTNTKDTYKLYLWIDGSMENNSNMQGQPFTLNIRATGTNSLLSEYVDINGIMTLANGEPCSECEITLFSEPRRTITDTTGNYSFTYVPVGEHTIVAKQNNVEVLNDTFILKYGDAYSYSSDTVTLASNKVKLDIKMNADKSINDINVSEKTLELTKLVSWGGSARDEFRDAIISYDQNGNVDGYLLVTQISGNGTIIKSDLNGNEQWSNVLTANKTVYLQSAAVSRNSNNEIDGYIVAGYTSATNLGFKNKGSYDDAILIKYDLNGNQEWIKNYGGGLSDYFYSVTLSYNSSGVPDGYIVAGTSHSTNAGFVNKGGDDAILVKCDFNGTQQWLRSYGTTAPSSANDIFLDIVYSYDDNKNIDGYIVTGNINHLPDVALIKYDLNGSRQWIRNYGGTGGDVFESISPSYQGEKIDGYLVTGYVNSTELVVRQNGKHNALIAKYDLSGTLMSVSYYPGNGHNIFHSIESLPFNNSNNKYIVFAISEATDFGFDNKGLANIIVGTFE